MLYMLRQWHSFLSVIEIKFDPMFPLLLCLHIFIRIRAFLLDIKGINKKKKTCRYLDQFIMSLTNPSTSGPSSAPVLLWQVEETSEVKDTALFASQQIHLFTEPKSTTIPSFFQDHLFPLSGSNVSHCFVRLASYYTTPLWEWQTWRQIAVL